MLGQNVLNRSVESKDQEPAGPKGHRAYAVGDIHGRLDLLEELLELIESDCAGRGKAKTCIIFLGDLVDRGPQSAEVVERLRLYRPAFAKTVFLMGNHEEVLLRLLGGEMDLLANWLLYGGAECALSYGIDPEALERAEPDEALAMLRRAIPKQHELFLSGFADTASFGDYLFVHAGIRPGVPLASQAKSDLLWIRRPFLDHEGEHGHVVVHGHTISEEVEFRPNRIGLDTGAYRTGILTALGIEGRESWLLQTGTMQQPEWSRVANVAEAY